MFAYEILRRIFGKVSVVSRLYFLEFHPLYGFYHWEFVGFLRKPINWCFHSSLASMALEGLEPSLSLPRFTGSNPARWLYEAERYFSSYAIYEEERFPFVVEFFDDEPFYWFNSWYRGLERLTWRSFTTTMLTTFTNNDITELTTQISSLPSSSIPSAKLITHDMPKDEVFSQPQFHPLLLTRHSTTSPTYKCPRYQNKMPNVHCPFLFVSVFMAHTIITTKLYSLVPNRTLKSRDPNDAGRREWRPPWRHRSVLEDKDVFQGGSIDTCRHHNFKSSITFALFS